MGIDVNVDGIDVGAARGVGAGEVVPVVELVAVLAAVGAGVVRVVSPVDGISHTKCLPTMQENGFQPFGSYG